MGDVTDVHAERLLARRVVSTRFEDLPADVVATAQTFVLDTLGTAAAGSSATATTALLDQIARWGGPPEATLLVDGRKVAAPWAALANGTMAHARDFDDTHEPAETHCTVSMLPALLAAAQAEGGVSGRELITAIAVGVDVVGKVGTAARLFHGWHPTGVLGALGTAAAVARVLKLDEDGVLNALGIAYSQAAGQRQGRHEGALTKRLHAGLAAKAGLTSAYLARVGITGAHYAVTGPWGLYRLYARLEPDAIPAAAARLADMAVNDQYEIRQLSTKPYPCCRLTHGAIDQMLHLIRTHGLTADQVKRVRVTGSLVIKDTVGKPYRPGRSPQVDAQFSVAYTLAVALRRGEVLLSDFEPGPVLDPETVALAQRIEVTADPAILSGAFTPITVAVQTDGGEWLEAVAHMVKGDPASPLTRAELEIKFRGCVAMAAPALDPGRIAKLLVQVRQLPEAADVAVLPELLVAEGRGNH